MPTDIKIIALKRTESNFFLNPALTVERVQSQPIELYSDSEIVDFGDTF